MDPQKLALLKKALRNLSGAIDVLSEREREQLKELIVKGQVASEEDLRGYLSRLIASRARLRERDKLKVEERRQLARKQQAEDEQGGVKKPALDENEATLEVVAGGGGGGGGSGQGAEDEPAKITGKVIDAKSRKALAWARVRVIGTSFNEDTEITGVFIWEAMPRGRQITFEITKKGYKNASLQYRATLDNEQHVVAKLVPQEHKGDKKGGPGEKKAGGH